MIIDSGSRGFRPWLRICRRSAAETRSDRRVEIPTEQMGKPASASQRLVRLAGERILGGAAKLLVRLSHPPYKRVS
jgi:hypothetical protein